jgi:hypothetical protein
MKSRGVTGSYVAILTLAGLGVLGFGGTTARAREAGGNYTGAGGEYHFNGYLRDPINLLALRHDIAEMVEALVRM